MVIAEGLKEFFDRKFAEMDRKAAAQERERRRAEREQLAAEIKAAQAAGRAAVNQRWQGWNARRLAAKYAGAEFTEPPPSPPTLEPAAPSSNETHPAGPK